MTEPERLFLTWQSEESDRSAEVCEELDSVWLYLTEPGSRKVAADNWLLNTPSAPDQPAQEPYRLKKSPPPVPRPLLQPGGIGAVPKPDRWTIRWAEGGHAVAALVDGVAIAWTRAGQRGGRARYIKVGGESWAHPWDQREYEATFQDERG